MTVLRSLMPLGLTALILSAADVRAQGAFPAPLPSQSAPSQSAPSKASPFPPANSAASPFPPSNSAASPFPAPASGAPAGSPPGGEQCMQKFIPLRQDAERKAGLIRAASARKAPPAEACKLITSFATAEIKMISFIEANSSKCGIPPQVGKQMKDGHTNTEKLRTNVCNVAAQHAQGGGGGPAAPSLSEVLGTSSALPEARATKRGGATFDTLNGSALDR